ncbi:Auxin-responsive protein SAUR36 [Carex littledalei]|uniref:Auxin-responsive protein SAUR36 n=1 Tax=Carex littledalei TaxID=544730 RepID=A0A833QTD4_9POAL|nr:Auxin-responsive protein SAUR36 [Carex littledalei]
MLSPKKLVQMAKKWQRMAVLGRRRLTFERKLSHRYADQITTTSPRGEKGHFVVYTIDEKRFMTPLDYLNTRIIMQLFQLSEEEFGYTVDGPITLPCEAAFMEYAMDLIKRGVSQEVEQALLSFVLLPCHHACSAQINFGAISQQVEVCGF